MKILNRNYRRTEEDYCKLLREYDESLQVYHKATGVDKTNRK